MFVIKQNRKSKYLQREEDDISIAFNLVSNIKLATPFTTREEATRIRDEAVEQGKNQIETLKYSNDPLASLDIESITDQYLSLIVTESK